MPKITIRKSSGSSHFKAPVPDLRQPIDAQPVNAQPDSPLPSEPAYKVGYGKPPREHQWKKGESGNIRGRPRRNNFVGDHIAELDRMVTVIENGRRRRITAQRAMARVQVQAAIANKGRAHETLRKMVASIEKPEFPPIPEKKLEELKDAVSGFIYRALKEGYNQRVAEEGELNRKKEE